MVCTYTHNQNGSIVQSSISSAVVKIKKKYIHKRSTYYSAVLNKTRKSCSNKIY